VPAIGSVNVKVAATTAGLTTGFAGAAKQIKTFSSNVRGMGSGLSSGLASAGAGITGLIAKLGPLAVAAAGVAGIAGIGAMVKSSMDSIDATAKMADSLGISTEAMVGMEHAANLSGVSNDALKAGLNRLARQGLDIGDVADRMASITDPTERAQYAFKVLGKSGQDMIPLLKDGAAALHGMVAEGAELKGFSREDAAAVEEANDAISRIQASFVGVANTVAITLAPAMTWVAEKATWLGKSIKTVFDMLRPVVTQWGNALMAMFSAIGDLVSPIFGGIGTTAMELFTNLRDFAFDWFATSEWAWQNVGRVATFAWENIKLGLLVFWEELKHTFAVRIPATISWFRDNFTDVMFTATDYALTVLINLGQNIRNVWQGVLDFIAGKGFNVDFTPLTEGAFNAIKKMPDIPERIMGDVEKGLRQSVKTMGDEMGADLGAHIAKRRAELIPPTEKASQDDLMNMELSGGGPAAQKDLAGPAAARRGTAEAFSAIFAAMRGKGDPMTTIAKTSEQSLAEQKKQSRDLRRLVERESVELVMGAL
jgi:hypothetical protein